MYCEIYFNFSIIFFLNNLVCPISLTAKAYDT